MIAPSGVTDAQGAVMPTNPASTPLSVVPTSGLANFLHETSMAKIEPLHAAKNVFTAMRETVPSAVVVEPALKPNQPKNRMNTPKAAIPQVVAGNSPWRAVQGILAQARADHEGAGQGRPSLQPSGPPWSRRSR